MGTGRIRSREVMAEGVSLSEEGKGGGGDGRRLKTKVSPREGRGVQAAGSCLAVSDTRRE